MLLKTCAHHAAQSAHCCQQSTYTGLFRFQYLDGRCTLCTGLQADCAARQLRHIAVEHDALYPGRALRNGNCTAIGRPVAVTCNMRHEFSYVLLCLLLWFDALLDPPQEGKVDTGWSCCRCMQLMCTWQSHLQFVMVSPAISAAGVCAALSEKARRLPPQSSTVFSGPARESSCRSAPPKPMLVLPLPV
jgi:hypothetical protein